jgi:hypothetical protein
MQRTVQFLAALLLAASLPAAEINRADARLADYFRNETAELSSRCLADLGSRADWEARRPELRRQLQEMLGLWPMPERTDLKPVITGVLTNEDFTVEKIYFQASPKLYCTANLFIPKNLTNAAPTILYECGHWRLFTNGISYGNKAAYQLDGAWFARNGYVCLVLDTLLAGEVQGTHTGTRDKGQWWWNSRGYTPAGVEAWFGIRALDYLCTRPEVDTNRFGITGHSGGGAYSWTVTALDDRIKAAAPLAGMADAASHIGDGVIDSHCDCNFFQNIYRWDFPQVAALAAPRPLLLGGTDSDRLFRLESTERIFGKISRVYQLLGATNNLGFALAPGPHDEVPELRLAVMRWFNRFLKGVKKENEQPIVVDSKKFFTPEQVRVFAALPADSINTNIAETFVLQSAITADKLRATLREKVFAGWPDDGLPLEPKRAFAVERDGVKFSAWDFASQHDVSLRLYIFENAKSPATNVSLTVLDAAGWTNWLTSAAVFYDNALTNELAQSFVPRIIDWFGPLPFTPKPGEALAFLAPRGVGLDAWSGDEKALTKIRRRFMLLGQTMDGMRVWDIRRAIQTLHFVRDGDAQVELKADGAMAVNALYAALFEPGVKKLSLTNLPASQIGGPDYLGVLKFTDIAEVSRLVTP